MWFRMPAIQKGSATLFLNVLHHASGCPHQQGKRSRLFIRAHSLVGVVSRRLVPRFLLPRCNDLSPLCDDIVECRSVLLCAGVVGKVLRCDLGIKRHACNSLEKSRLRVRKSTFFDVLAL